MKSTPGPLVSILINNYNYAGFVGKAIESALAQTYPRIEVVVTDDGSTDNSLDVLKTYGARIRLVAKENGGQASAINSGFAASKGEIICLLDADDLFVPEKIKRVVEILTEDSQLGWCFDTLHEFDSRGNGERLNAERYLSREIPWGKWDVRGRTLAGKPPYIPTATSGLSFRRALLSQIVPMPEVIRITSDNYIKLLGLALAEGWFTSEKLTLQRIHDNNAFTNRKGGKRSLASRIEVITGISIYEKSDSLQILGKGLVGYGLGTLWLSGGLDADTKNRVGRFLRGMGVHAACSILARTVYWGLRRSLTVI